MHNVGFLRTRIEFIDALFAENEVSEIWITFPDPQLKTRRAKKRLTSPLYLACYARLLRPDGWINLKTSDQTLFLGMGLPITYTRFALGGRHEFPWFDWEEDDKEEKDNEAERQLR